MILASTFESFAANSSSSKSTSTSSSGSKTTSSSSTSSSSSKTTMTAVQASSAVAAAQQAYNAAKASGNTAGMAAAHAAAEAARATQGYSGGTDGSQHISTSTSSSSSSSGSNSSNSGTSSNSSSNNNSSVNTAAVILQMQANSQTWKTASSTDQAKLAATNQQLGASIGATYNSSSGTWTFPAVTNSSSGSSGSSSSTINVASIQAQMTANSAAWKTATPAQQEALHEANIALAAQLGGTYNSASGTWTVPTSSSTLNSSYNTQQNAIATYQSILNDPNTTEAEKQFIVQQAKVIGISATYMPGQTITTDLKGNAIVKLDSSAPGLNGTNDWKMKDANGNVIAVPAGTVGAQPRYLGVDASGNKVTNPNFPDENPNAPSQWQLVNFQSTSSMAKDTVAASLIGYTGNNNNYSPKDLNTIANTFLANNPDWANLKDSSGQTVWTDQKIEQTFVIQPGANGFINLVSVHTDSNNQEWYKTFTVYVPVTSTGPGTVTLGGVTPQPPNKTTEGNNPVTAVTTTNNTAAGGNSVTPIIPQLTGNIRFSPNYCDWRNSNLPVSVYVEGDPIPGQITVSGNMLDSTKMIAANGTGMVTVNQEGIGNLHGVLAPYADDSGTYKIDKTVPVVNFDWSNQDRVSDIGQHVFVYLQDNKVNAVLGDNLSGIVDSRYYWSTDNTFPNLSAMTSLGLSTADGSSGTVNASILVHDTAKRLKGWYLHVYLKDRAGNETRSTQSIYIEARLEKLKVIDIKDPAWKAVFRNADGSYNGSYYPAANMPVDNNPLYANAYPKKGYSFSFSLLSKGLNETPDVIKITPTFYWEADVNGTNRQEADLYYNLGGMYLIKVGSSRDNSNITNNGSTIGGFGGLTLTSAQRGIIDPKQAIWVGNYYLSSSTFAVIKGKDPGNSSNILNGGFIVVQFQLEAYKDGIMMFQYTPTQYTAEEGPKRPTNHPGDVMVFNNSKSALDDYDVGTDR